MCKSDKEPAWVGAVGGSGLPRPPTNWWNAFLGSLFGLGEQTGSIMKSSAGICLTNEETRALAQAWTLPFPIPTRPIHQRERY